MQPALGHRAAADSWGKFILQDPLKSNLATRPANAIGALRLLFASLVIVAHSPQMLDGDKGRELLYRLTGTMSLGTVAVDAFFLISGYLIAASFTASSSLWSYAVKRVLRIGPAFVVCCLICIFIVAPLGGAHLTELGLRDWAKTVFNLITLKAPEVRGAFVGLPYPALNGSAWTISYEFRCYILAAVFGLMGLYRHRNIFLAITAGILASNLVFFTPVGAPLLRSPGWFDAAFGEPQQALRLLSAFVVGTTFWLYSDRIVYRGVVALICAIAACGLLFIPALAEIGMIIFGGYVLFTVAFKATWRPLQVINSREDISYGVYLYAWPVAALLIWYWRDVPIVVLGTLTFLAALVCGAVSWFVVEKPAMRVKSHA